VLTHTQEFEMYISYHALKTVHEEKVNAALARAARRRDSAPVRKEPHPLTRLTQSVRERRVSRAA
jgi:hypothetical protein